MKLIVPLNLGIFDHLQNANDHHWIELNVYLAFGAVAASRPNFAKHFALNSTYFDQNV